MQPYLDELVKFKTATLREGSNAAPIPPYATASFTTASNLLNSNNAVGLDVLNAFGDVSQLEDEMDSLRVKKVRKPIAKTVDDVKQEALGIAVTLEKKTKGTTILKEKAVRKPRVKKTDVGPSEDTGLKTKAARKPRAKKSAIEQPEDHGPKKKVTRKSRSKKVDGETQAKLPAGQVAKAGINKNEKMATTVSIHFSPKKASDIWKEDFGLEEAVPRRTAWTPPPKLSEIIARNTPEPFGTIDLSEDAAGGTEGRQGKPFSDLLGSFGYCNGNVPIVQKIVPKSLGPKKRKLVELVASSVSTKSVKKKARTLTDLATSAYGKEPSPEPAALLQYFPRETKERATSNGFKIPSKSRSLTKKTNKGTAKVPILLSPESALKQVTSQDFVFGTSSQLAREQSPTLLRDLHAAMQASNEVDDDPFTDILSEISKSSDAPIAKLYTKRNLWSAAARDEIPQDELQPQIDETDINVTPPKPDKTLEPQAKKSKKTIKKTETEMPNFEAYTTAQLTKQVASYRFKPVKKREQMILLLEKCWESKQRIALGVLGTNDTIGSSPKKPVDSAREKILSNQAVTSSPKKSKGRPRKDSTSVSPGKSKPSRTRVADEAATVETDFDSDVPLFQIRTPKKSQIITMQAIEDISDSDIEVTPSLSFKSQKRSPTALLPLQLSSPALPDDSPLLFDSITKAVMTGGSAKDSKNPSWHEKILLYDPIVLEDLTVWLNTGGLEKAGWDGEVEPKEVKKWCESKSICCLWRESLRNGTRNRY